MGSNVNTYAVFSTSDFPKRIIRKMCKAKLFTRYNQVKGDNVELMPFLFKTLSYINYKLARYIIYIATCLVSFMVLFQTYHFLKVFNKELWMQYTSFYFVTIYMALSMPLALAFYNLWNQVLIPIRKCVATDMIFAGDVVNSKIINEANNRSRWFIIHSGFTMALMLVNLISFSRNKTSFFLISLLLKDILPKQLFDPLHWMFYVHAVCIVYPMCLPPYWGLYGFSYIKFQIILLTKLANDFSIILKRPELRLHNEELFHENVRDKLQLIIMRHQEVLLFSRKMEMKGRTSNFFYAITSLLILFYMIFAAFSPVYGWLQPFVGFLTFWVWMGHFCQEGQAFEDTSMQFLSVLNNMGWPDWNHPNKRTLHIMLIVAGVPLKIPITSFMAVNYEFLKKVVKLMYSVGNILNST